MSEIPDTSSYTIAGYALFLLGTAAYILYLSSKWKAIIRKKVEQDRFLKEKRNR